MQEEDANRCSPVIDEGTLFRLSAIFAAIASASVMVDDEVLSANECGDRKEKVILIAQTIKADQAFSEDTLDSASEFSNGYFDLRGVYKDKKVYRESMLHHDVPLFR